MAVTGDWTMVKNGEEGSESSDANSNTNNDVDGESPAAAVRFPCIEQPTRVTLHCNGYYLWGCRNGKLIARKKRSEKDEWRIENSHCVVGEEEENNSDASNGNSRNQHVVNICNHKFGGRLSLVDIEEKHRKEGGPTKTVVCIKDESAKTGTKNSKTEDKQNIGGNEASSNDLGLNESIDSEEVVDFGDDTEPAALERLPDDEEDPEGGEDGENMDGVLDLGSVDQEHQQWCLVRCGDGQGSSGLMIQSLTTGDRLAITDDGKITLVPASAPEDSSVPSSVSGLVWEMECVTGELCFLSNPALDVRVRCDMAGLLTLSPNWKGWEVVRILESSGDGYVKLSSWMHSQWLLCSDAEGNVTTCSHADSLLSEGQHGESDFPGDQEPQKQQPFRCSKWAIEKYQGSSGPPGVIIRSKTHNRLLSIRDGVLRTFDSLEDISRQASAILEECAAEDCETEDNSGGGDDAAEPQSQKIADIVKRSSDEVKDAMKRGSDEVKRRGSDWWKTSVKNVQKKMSDTAIQRRNSKNPVDFLRSSMTRSGRDELQAISSSIADISEGETIVWQLEAAHLQTYYFLSSPSEVEKKIDACDEEDGDETQTPDASIGKPRSIGAFPNVTENLRTSDKIQLVRNDKEINTIKLYLTEKNLYVTCSSKGVIFLTENEGDEGSDWIMDQQKDGGSVFRSKAHGLYLSYKETENNGTKSDGGDEQAAPAEDLDNDGDSSIVDTDNNNNNTKPKSPSARGSVKFKNHLQNLLQKNNTVTELCGVSAMEPSALWKLEPCTPRAVSSEKLKTFAIGTSIAVGTTIAMPFALAGVAAVMGAVGAEAGIGFGIVAAGLTGVEAMASVGAIGATAYICFKPAQNSLTDDHQAQDGSDEKPWSKRPFSNWRNW
ncbi:unnamed protein product [Pseudo-nitzschia multistriata]|uniref:Fascin domain-containing protein n=1 Tax=Pseudo-nitzschia multistriata TaxID=183589 RepID=A0A448YYU1_9STRA|nr:unnamed protein product [Pseudo-nitzschia multistriata]